MVGTPLASSSGTDATLLQPGNCDTRSAHCCGVYTGGRSVAFAIASVVGPVGLACSQAPLVTATATNNEATRTRLRKSKVRMIEQSFHAEHLSRPSGDSCLGCLALEQWLC